MQRASVLNVVTQLTQLVGHDVIYDVLNVHLLFFGGIFYLPLIDSFKIECLGL